MLSWAKLAAARLGELDSDDDRISGLAAEEGELANAVGELAGQLTAARKQAAGRFAADVTAELTALAMPHARLTVAITPLPGPARTAAMRWRSSSPPTPARPRSRCTRAHPGASCRG